MKPSLFSPGCVVILALLAFCACAARAEPDALAYQARRDADGVQRVALLGGNYFFRPDHIVVQAGQPLELAVNVEPGIVPHSFVLEAADGTVLADVQLAAEAKTLRLNLPPGKYIFYCAKRLLGFKSHRERGMAGLLEAKE